MHRILVASVALAAALLSGCFPLSLNPIYTTADTEFLPQLEGIWSDSGSEPTWTFTRESRIYWLVLKADDDPSYFRAQPARVQGLLLLDFYPDQPNYDFGLIGAVQFVGVHSFAVVRQVEPTLMLSFMKEEWLEKHLRDHPGSLDYVRQGSRLILTSPTTNLQRFVIEHQDDQDAFYETVELSRIQPD